MAREVWTITFNPSKSDSVQVSLLGRNPDLADLFGLIAAVGRLGQSAIKKAEEEAAMKNASTPYQPQQHSFVAPDPSQPVPSPVLEANGKVSA